MEELNTHVLKGFGIKAKRIIKEKAYYICDTGHGVRMIKKSYDNCDHIVFQHAIKEHLHDAGFHYTDRYHLSETGVPYFSYGDSTYVMTDMPRLKEADFCSRHEFGLVIGQIAQMHKLTRSITFEGKVFYGNADPVDGYKKRLSELSAIKKKVGGQKRLSDFDVMFIKNYGHYTKQLDSCIQALEKTSYARLAAESARQMHICHHALKEENILIGGEDVTITKFSNAMIDCQLNDLCGVIRRHIRNNHGDGMPFYEILDIYNQTIPLRTEDLRILFPLLRYPYHFIKICGQYYVKKRTWTPSAIVNRMEAILSVREGYESYIETAEASTS